jgi:hypothetical protein
VFFVENFSLFSHENNTYKPVKIIKIKPLLQECVIPIREFLNFEEAQELIRVIDSASLCSLSWNF